MKKNRFIATICTGVLAVVGLFLASCNPDIDGGSNEREQYGDFAVKSYFPTKVVAGSKIQITGNGLDRVSTVVFTVASESRADETQSVNVTDFEKVGANMINVTVPARIEPGSFKLIAEDGAELLVDYPALTVGAPVALTISPGDEAGVGGKIEVTGTDMEFFSKAVFPAMSGGVVEVPAVDFLRISTGVVWFRVPELVAIGPAQIKLVALDGTEATLKEIVLTAAKGPEVEPKNEISGVWTWAQGTPYSGGGYGNTLTPETGWSQVAFADLGADRDNVMIFTTTGYQKVTPAGEVLESSSYVLDTEATRPQAGSSALYSIAELTIPDATVLRGEPRWGGDPIHFYYVTAATDYTADLYLGHGVEEQWGAWDQADIWHFVRVPAINIAASINNTLIYQRQDIVIDGIDKSWWIDPDFFGVTAAEDGTSVSLTNFVFKPVSGHYRIVRDEALKYVTAIPLTADGALPTLQADGSGTVWVIGDATVGKPSFAVKGVNWTPANGFPMAQIAPKVHRVTLTAGRHIETNAINFKFFHQQAWGGEVTNANLTYTGSLLKIGTGSNGADPGNLNLATGVTLKNGVNYEFTLDMTAGGRNMGILTVVEK